MLEFGFFRTVRPGILLLNVIFCVCMGCQQNVSRGYLTYQEFPNSFSCNSSEIPLDTVLFRYPFRIKVMDEKAVVLDLHNPDYYYHLFSYPDFKPLASFGRRGNSPQEMLSGESVLFISADSIYTLDANKSEIRRWGIDAEEQTVQLRDLIKLEGEVLRALDFARIDDSTFIIPDYSGKNRFCRVNNRGQIVSRQGRIPSTEIARDDIPLPALAQAWRSFLSYNPRNNILAMVTQLGEVLEVYRLEDSTYHFVSMGPHGEPHFKIHREYAVPTGIMGFSDVHVAEHYIYAVFHGQSFKDIRMQGSSAVDGGKFVYVFDLEGVPVCKYDLDRSVYAIYLDELRGKFIALDVNSDQPIVEYALPESE